MSPRRTLGSDRRYPLQ